MSEDKAEEKKEGDAAAAKPKGKKKLLIIIVAVVLLLGGGGGAMMMMGGKKEVPAGEPKEEVKHYATFEVPTIIVNLSETTAFLKVGLLVEYDPEILAKAEGAAGGSGGGHGGGASGGEDAAAKGGFPGPLAKREPMIKDAIIRVLSSKKTDELLTSDGKDRVKEELIEAINEASAIEEGAVVAIYFTEFLIQ